MPIPVYPRASGGTIQSPALASIKTGLSPRERGNRAGAVRHRGYRRSIPARAGEPRHPTLRAGLHPVYPRASGGTRRLLRSWRPCIGLSPRERGNLLLGTRQRSFERSIPARAGEPGTGGTPRALARVYPRASGGTRRLLRSWRPCIGLSPRERGNLLLGTRQRSFDRSIPARAGEPSSMTSGRAFSGVYPRASGGTSGPGLVAVSRWGLSPRERGNHAAARGCRARYGSIPARAGEPPTGFACSQRVRVYPRASGGTRICRAARWAGRGLSPRERGNPDT